MEKMNIKADRDYLDIFLDKIMSGSYVVPEFQRSFVWTSKMMIDLFDSIIKGFPIGSVILWKPDTDDFSIINNIEGVKIPKQNSGERYYILDGRQRITTLISVLKKSGSYRDTIYVDLDTFDVFGKSKQKNPLWISVTEAFDTYALVEYIESLKKLPLKDEEIKQYAERAKKLNKILISYEVGYITVRGGRIDEAVEIFYRLNSKGTDISPDFMIQALSYNKQKGFLFSTQLEKIQCALEEYNFSHIKKDLILKCIYIYKNIFFIDGKTEDILSIENLPEVMKSVEGDILKTVHFLYEECGVIEYKLLPYSYQFIMLALFFKNNPSVTPEQKKELRKWFYYTSYSNYFTNTSLAYIRKDIALFEAYSKGMEKYPIRYEKKIKIGLIPATIALGAVRSCCFVLSSIHRQLLNRTSKENISLSFYNIPIDGVKSAATTICCISKSRKNDISSLFIKSRDWKDKYAEYVMNADLYKSYKEKRGDFETKRSLLLYENEKLFAKEMLYGIDVV